MKKSIIFPGQGSQYVGMGADIYQNFEIAKEIFEEIDEALNFKLSNIIFSDPENLLNLTVNTQPAIMATGVAIFKVLEKNFGIQISDYKYCAGHSLGEYTALVCSGALSAADAAKILKARGESMQNAVKLGEGGMAAILGSEVTEIEKIILENKFLSVEISNDNCPGQIVISGKIEEVKNCCLLIKKNLSKKSIFLPVSAPFHCELMKPAAENMKDIILKSNLKKPIIPMISNVTANVVSNETEIKSLLIEQIFKRVRWREIIQLMIDTNIDEIHEIGPGKSLSSMVKRFKSEIIIKNYSSLEDFKI